MPESLFPASAIPPGIRTVYASFSGGADSLALLLSLKSLRDAGAEWELRAVHFEHGIRGPEADGDEDFVKAFCAENGVTLHTARLDLAGREDENTAREARYRVYAQTMDGKVAHFRDRYGLEIDLVVSLPDGRWGGVEVKLGSGRIDEAAMNLAKIAGRIDEERMGKPSFLMVLTGTKFAFRRPDGVYVVPLGCLRP